MQPRVRHGMPRTRDPRSCTLLRDGLSCLPAKHFHRFQGHQTDIRNIVETIDKSPQPLILIDDLDDHGTVTFEDVPTVDMRRSAEAERSEEHTSELQSLMRISYAVFCLKKKKRQKNNTTKDTTIKNT